MHVALRPRRESWSTPWFVRFDRTLDVCWKENPDFEVFECGMLGTTVESACDTRKPCCTSQAGSCQCWYRRLDPTGEYQEGVIAQSMFVNRLSGL